MLLRHGRRMKMSIRHWGAENVVYKKEYFFSPYLTGE